MGFIGDGSPQIISTYSFVTGLQLMQVWMKGFCRVECCRGNAGLGGERCLIEISNVFPSFSTIGKMWGAYHFKVDCRGSHTVVV